MGRAARVVGFRTFRRAGLASSVLAVAASWLAPVRPALAEWRVETTIAPPPVLRPRIPAARPPRIELPPAEEAPDAAAAERPAEDGDPEEADRDEGTPAQASASDAERDAETLPEPQGPQDGIIVVGEPTAARDGVWDPRADARLAQDTAAFRDPPAGYNPYLFTIEPEPLADRRIAQLFHLEPSEARGVRIGSFVLFPEAQLGGIATDNIFRDGTRRGDGALEVGASARLVSDWRAHAVELRASGLTSFYGEHPTEDDLSYALEARGRLDLTKRTNIEALVSHQGDKDKRGLLDSPGAAAARGDVATDRLAAALNHRFNRLSLQLRGSLTDIDFAPVASTGGGIISNAERSTTQREVAVRASWALTGTTEIFAEAAANDREFEVAPADGILRSSTGERYRLGVAFGPASNILRGEISAGWGRQLPRDGRLGDIDGLIVDASLAWRASALTTFLLTIRSDFTDTTTSGSAGALSRLAGLEVRHAFRRHLVGTAGIKYTLNPYDGVSIDERDLTAELGLDYYVGRYAVLYARYQHTDFASTAPGSDYSLDIVRAGVRVRQ
ncbi:MAG TPA: outer membrane beta-barrel protein [Hyphomicrobiaceae bacterium]|nr:outer membrane beta-barrel protein [Hyphomicrobiaceae bacterium]